MINQKVLDKMIFPSMRRPQVKPYGGVIQIHVTRICDKSCNNCTQGSNLKGKVDFITLKNFELACRSLQNYFGVVGVFGGNPALHPEFHTLCNILKTYIPYERRGIWCNNPISVEKAVIMKNTFNPAVSNLNVHMDKEAYELFKQGWPNSNPFGLDYDSRHAPVYVAMKDVLKEECKACQGTGDGPGGYECSCCLGTGDTYNEELAWELISKCDINQNWSAMCGQFRGELRGWFCEIAGAQSILNQDDPNYPDTGIKVEDHDGNIVSGINYANRKKDGSYKQWWELSPSFFEEQVEKHCNECGVPLKGYGELATREDGIEQCSKTYEKIYRPKGSKKQLKVVEHLEQLGTGRIEKFTKYLQNSKK